MLPRLPPLLLAAIGGASVYGIKYMLDRLEPKAIGPPSTDHYERVLKYRQNVKQAGIACAATGVLYCGYLLYESRQHRISPAVLVGPDNVESFYQDQYKEREKRFAIEREKAKNKEKEKEEKVRIQLDKEIAAMEDAIKKNNKGENGL